MTLGYQRKGIAGVGGALKAIWTTLQDGDAVLPQEGQLSCCLALILTYSHCFQQLAANQTINSMYVLAFREAFSSALVEKKPLRNSWRPGKPANQIVGVPLDPASYLDPRLAP